MLVLDQVTFQYPGGSPLFDQFSWRASAGQSWAVLGPSGCGKTSLLYLLAGLQFPQSGSVQVDSQPLLRPRPQTGLILQDYGLLPWATVRENAALGERIRRFYGPDGRHAPAAPLSAAAVDAWLERLGLNEVANQYPGKLSGGQRQRTAIARTLALSPDLLLMDEPFSSLDALTRQDLQQLTLQLWREKGFTFIMVTHAIEEAAALGQQVLVLGKPPHRTPVILPNPAFGQPVGSPAFTAFCAALRAQLEAA